MEKNQENAPQKKRGQNLLGGKNHVPATKQLRLPDFHTAKDYLPKHKRTIFLLAEGINMKRISSILNEKYDTIKKRAARAVRDGIIEREPFRQPALHKRGENWEIWQKTTMAKRGDKVCLGGRKKPDITAPHRFGVQYYIGSESYRDSLQLQGLRRRYHLSRLDERENLSAIWDRRVLTIWVHRFVRGTPQEKIRDGLKTAKEYADAHGAAGARLRFKRLLGRIEWILADKPLSSYVVGILGLKRGDFLQIGQTQWGLDKSHPDNVELNKLAPYADHKPTEYVEILQFLLDKDKMLSTMKAMKEALEHEQERSMLLEQKINMLEAKIKGGI